MTTTVPGVSNQVLPPDELAAIDKAVGWPQPDIAQAVAIEENQSVGGNTAAFNPTDPAGGSVGLFQINGVHAPGGQLTQRTAAALANPVVNAEEALRLFKREGWVPWKGDPSLSPPFQNLAIGQQAAASIAGESSQGATIELTSSSNSGGGYPAWAAAAPGLWALLHPGQAQQLPVAAGAQVATSLLPTSAGSSVMKVLLYGVGLLAGVGLIVLGIHEAGHSNSETSKGHPLRDAAIGAAA